MAASAGNENSQCTYLRTHNKAYRLSVPFAFFSWRQPLNRNHRPRRCAHDSVVPLLRFSCSPENLKFQFAAVFVHIYTYNVYKSICLLWYKGRFTLQVQLFFLFSLRFLEFSNIILMIWQIIANILSEIVDVSKSKFERVVF